MSVMAEIFSGLASMSHSDMTKPRSIPPRNPKSAILGIKLRPVFPQLCEHIREVEDQIACLFRLEHNVVDVSFDYPTYEISKDMLHASLEHGDRVFEPERHRVIIVGVDWSDKRRYELINTGINTTGINTPVGCPDLTI
jgi:hypothetical protein